MKKGLVTLMAAVAVGTLGGAARPGGAAPPVSAVARCDGGRVARSDVHGLAVGAGFAGADGGAIRQTTAAGAELIAPPDRGPGIVRHVASRAGVGTAYVRDRKGGDLVVSVTERGVRRYSTHAEASQPALSARGDLVWAERSGLRLVVASGRAPRPIVGPIPGGVTMSPPVASATTIVGALAQAADPAGRGVPGGGRRVGPALEHRRGRDGSLADPAGARRREPRGRRLRRRHGRSARPHGSRQAFGGPDVRDRCGVAS